MWVNESGAGSSPLGSVFRFDERRRAVLPRLRDEGGPDDFRPRTLAPDRARNRKRIRGKWCFVDIGHSCNDVEASITRRAASAVLVVTEIALQN